MKIHTTYCLVVLIVLAASDAAAQQRHPCAVAQPGALVLYGDLDQPITLTPGDLAALPQTSVEAIPHGGTATTYSGPRLEHVLAKADLPRGAWRRGNQLLVDIVWEAVAGYRAVFALAELDSGFRLETPILALTRNGEALEADAAPFQVIVPGEQRHARWVRQIACIRISQHQ